MSRARSVADLGNQNVLSVSATNGNINVGTGVTLENTGEAQFSGIVTAPSIDTRNLIGDVSIGGVLTYEDVTSVDSIGVITARNGLVVGSGATIVGLSTFTKVAIGGTAVSSDPTFNRALLHVYSDLQETGSNQDGISVGPLPHGAGAHHLALTYNRANDSGMLSVTTGRLGLTATQGVGLGNNVGIGTTRSPGSERLHVVGDSKFVGIVTSNSLDLDAIDKDITDSAVDVFVYDTSKDSDGGAWRKRTRNTSWYNEAASSTRGSRKEFPAVAVIVAEANKVTIYDGDDPDLPMWMVFNHSGAGIQATTAKNGVLYWGCSSASSDRTVYFIKDSYYRWWTTSAFTGYFNEPISGRNGTLTGGKGDTQVLVDGTTNDVAMTVLPNALIDDTTGLPVPTIAVATAAGVSVIRDDGKVVQKALTDAGTDIAKVEFTNDGFLIVNRNDYNYFVITTIEGTESELHPSGFTNNINYFRNNATNYPGPLSPDGQISGYGNQSIVKSIKGTDVAMADPYGLNIFNVTRGINSNDNMVAYITSNYNTGYLHGDIKGAFLSDTDTTNTAVAYSDGFSNNNNGWAFAAGGGQSGGSVTGGNLVLTQNSQARAYDVDALDGIPTGTKLVFTFTVGGSGTGTFDIDDDGAGAGVGGNTVYKSFSSTGSHIFTATKTASNRIRFYRQNGSNDYEIAFLNITTEYDRSANDKGLTSNGTVNKEPVAGTGVNAAELVSYGPFSNANYVKQLYNSDMNFGTGDISVTWWHYMIGDVSNAEYVYDRAGGNGNRHAVYYVANDDGRMVFYTNAGSSSEIFVNGINVYKDRWTCYTVTRSGSTGDMAIYIDGEEGYYAPAMDVRDLDNTSAELYIGVRHNETGAASQAKYALMRFSKSIPSPEQIKKMYEDEKFLFRPNAKATLPGSSDDDVTALAYDEDTDLLHVGTSSGRSEFQGLHRINNTTDAVTAAISASNDLVVEK